MNGEGCGTNGLEDGWFKEYSSLWPGEYKALKVEKVLVRKKSRFQDILLFQSAEYGRVLVLDGVIQVTERDECAYQEMMSHTPLASHPDPRSVLIIGGGDGGVAREVAKDPRVESITQCEIDPEVISVCKEFLPKLACGFESEKLTLTNEDGFEFMKRHKNSFDVIITDSSDPVGPAESLFQESYYSLVHASLKPNGIMCSQGESMWLHLDLIKSMKSFCQQLFPVVSYGYISIPTYPSGTIGLLLCSKDEMTKFSQPVYQHDDSVKHSLRYYSSDVHRAAFVLPKFVAEALA